MRRSIIAGSIVALAASAAIAAHPGDAARRAVAGAPPVTSADANAVSGIYLSTQYPALTVRAGETATIDLTLHNYHQPPRQFSLSVPQVASGWKA
ncbi:MAG: hypothetical protein JO081_19310, partial [Alphaproteobacteria bacterium]|nr:hypothetical protein [Alphaproteobacteria bacterium]